MTLTENVHLKARILDKDQWSALNETTYEVSAAFVVTP